MVKGEYMKKALIDTQTSIQHIVSWGDTGSVYETYPNSARICEVTDTLFEVHPSLIWVDCEDDIVPSEYYYDKETQTFKPIEEAPLPEGYQPATTGTQDL
jgi:hypothetical protein